MKKLKLRTIRCLLVVGAVLGLSVVATKFTHEKLEQSQQTLAAPANAPVLILDAGHGASV